MYNKDEHFAASITELRKSMGLTQQEMADMIDVRKTTICNYESGYATPTIATLKKMMHAFNLSANYFLDSSSVERKSVQFLFGATIPFYRATNIKGLTTADKTLMDSSLTLPSQIETNKDGYLATIAPDNMMNAADIKKGSCVVINTEKTLKDGCIFAAVKENELILRRYHNDKAGIYMSVESTRTPSSKSVEMIKDTELVIIGVVTKVIFDL